MTTPHRLTASGVPLALHCAYPFRLDAERAVDDPDRWAPYNAVHEAIAFTIRSGDLRFSISPELDAVLLPAGRAKAVASHGAWLGDWWADNAAGGWSAELAFAFDPETGEHAAIETSGHRDYSRVPAGWVPGTADAIRGHDADPRNVDVIDWKSGRFAPSVEDNAQLAVLGLGAGARDVRAAIGHVTEDGTALEWATLNAFDLDDWRARIRDVVRSIPGAEPVPGPWCRDKFCASYGLCPATAPSLDRAAPEAKRMLPVVAASSAIESPEHAAELYRVAREARAAFDARYNAVFEALRHYADDHGGIALPGGKTWIKRETTRESIDLTHPEAVAVLGRELGEEAFAAAVTYDTSKAAIKRAGALIKAKTGEAAVAVERRTVEALRKIGAVKQTVSTNYDEVKLLSEKNDAA